MAILSTFLEETNQWRTRPKEWAIGDGLFTFLPSTHSIYVIVVVGEEKGKSGRFIVNSCNFF